MSSAVCSDGETIEWRRVRRRDGLMRLRVSEGVDAGEVVGNLLRRGRLEKDVGVLAALECRGEGVGRLAESFGGDDGRCKRRGFVQVL